MPTDTPKKPEALFIPVELVTENDSGNPFGDVNRTYSLPVDTSDDPDAIPFGFSSASSEGFAGNIEGQKQIARFLAEKLNLKDRGPVIDVGFGQNVHISNTFAELGIESHAIDTYTSNKEPATDRSMFDVPPREVEPSEAGVHVYVGDAAELQNPKSALKDKRFGCVLYNGSWASGQNNFSVVGEMMEFKEHDLKEGKISRDGNNSSFYDAEKDRVVQASAESVKEGGLVGVVSARYAFHGGGYSFEQLPYEKIHFMDLYDRLRRQGAKKFYAFGVTPDGFTKQVQLSIDTQTKAGEKVLTDSEESVSVRDVHSALVNINQMPDKPEYFQERDGGKRRVEEALFAEMLERTKKVPMFSQLARIDALFAEF